MSWDESHWDCMQRNHPQAGKEAGKRKNPKSRECSWKRGKETMQEVKLRIEECVIKGNLGLEVRTN